MSVIGGAWLSISLVHCARTVSVLKPTTFGFMTSSGSVFKIVLNSFVYNNIYSEIVNMKVFLNFILSYKSRPDIVETQNIISYMKLNSKLLALIFLSQGLM